ncbi:hypothetical protein HYV56_01835 [Candidatus Peregrinibacteria bacterium]|nr:hypothetical protein [Candidatus Peregrinibacteria bacterium]
MTDSPERPREGSGDSAEDVRVRLEAVPAGSIPPGEGGVDLEEEEAVRADDESSARGLVEGVEGPDSDIEGDASGAGVEGVSVGITDPTPDPESLETPSPAPDGTEDKKDINYSEMFAAVTGNLFRTLASLFKDFGNFGELLELMADKAKLEDVPDTATEEGKKLFKERVGVFIQEMNGVLGLKDGAGWNPEDFLDFNNVEHIKILDEIFSKKFRDESFPAFFDRYVSLEERDRLKAVNGGDRFTVLQKVFKRKNTEEENDDLKHSRFAP